jgi:regulator of sigma E protease
MSILIAIFGFVLAIGVLVTVHEFGHYWVARRCGVRVLRFSIGFGRPLWARRYGRDQTEYCIGSIPLGGYVKMLDEREAPVPPAEQHRTFNRQSVPRRTAIVLAGPAFNFLFAILAYWLIFVAGIPGLKPVIGEVLEGTPAAEAGVRAGDEIRSVNGRNTPTWRVAGIELLDGILDQRPIHLDLLREDGSEAAVAMSLEGIDRRRLTEPGHLLEGLGMRQWAAALPPVLGQLAEGGAAVAAGLRPGDRILAVDGEPTPTWQAFRDRVVARPGVAVSVEFERGGRLERLEVTPEAVDSEQGVIGRIGAGPEITEEILQRMRAEQRYGPVAALGRGVANTWEMSALTVRMLGRMVAGQVSVKNLSGPINIAHYAGITVSSGLVSFLGFLAIVSISLGIINLLPIPMLDGGHLLYLGAEAVTGKPVSERVQIMGQQVGLLALAALISFAIYNDLARIFG